MGIGAYLAYFALYMALVEFGIYWMHRLLHDIRPGYRRVDSAGPRARLPPRPRCLHVRAWCAAWSAPQQEDISALLWGALSVLSTGVYTSAAVKLSTLSGKPA